MSQKARKNLLMVVCALILIVIAFVFIMNTTLWATQTGDVRIIEVDSKYCPGTGEGPCYKKQTCIEDDGCGACLAWDPEYP